MGHYSHFRAGRSRIPKVKRQPPARGILQQVFEAVFEVFHYYKCSNSENVNRVIRITHFTKCLIYLKNKWFTMRNFPKKSAQTYFPPHFASTRLLFFGDAKSMFAKS